MALQQLGSVHQAVDWLVLRGAAALATDSRRVRPGDAFIAWPGRAHDARAHVGAALAVGARACLVEADGVDSHAFDESLRAHGLNDRIGQDVIVYCDCPNEASAAIVAKKLMRVGFKRVRPLGGGIDAWIAKGYSVDTPG